MSLMTEMLAAMIIAVVAQSVSVEGSRLDKLAVASVLWRLNELLWVVDPPGVDFCF
jgi:hypothetical protein